MKEGEISKSMGKCFSFFYLQVKYYICNAVPVMKKLKRNSRIIYIALLHNASWTAFVFGLGIFL